VPGGSGAFIDLAREGSAQRFPLLLDTGASFSMLTPGLARELGIRVRASKGSPYRRATRLGRDLQFRVDTRRGDHASRIGIEFGLLGGNFLAQYVVEVDFPRRRVRFLDPDRFQTPEQTTAAEETVLSMQLVSSRPIVQAEIAGHPVSLLLDTGASFGVVMGGGAARAASLESRPAPGLSAVGVFGEVEVEFAEASRMRLGDQEFSDVPVVVAPRGLYQQGTASDSLIGLDLLSQFTLRIDYPRKRLWLRRDRASVPLFLGADYRLVRESGALLFRNEGSVLAAVILPGGAAERIGLQPRDVLEGFDPSAPDFDPASVHRAISGAEPLTVRRPEGGDRWRVLRLPQ
jgi:predicted aspartyl protease